MKRTRRMKDLGKSKNEDIGEEREEQEKQKDMSEEKANKK